MNSNIEPPNIPERVGKESICWFCKHSVPGKNKGCNWSRYGIPVEGWISIDSVRKRLGKNETYIGHKVQACPLFERS